MNIKLIVYTGVGIFVHNNIPTINPYTAKASASATTKNALKKDSSLSAREEIAAVPTVFIAIALPNTDAPTEIAADIAKIAEVAEL